MQADAPDIAIDPDRADHLEAAFRGTTAFAVLDPEPSAATLDAAFARLDPEQFAIIRIGNPLTAPLSVERVMLQLAPERVDDDGALLDEASRLLRAVTAAGRPCLLVVVEQAETLTAPALALLQLLPGLQTSDGHRVRVAFLGGPAFQAMLQDPRFSAIRNDDDGLEEETAPEPPVSFGTGTAVAPSLMATRRPSMLRRLALPAAAIVAMAALLVVAVRPSLQPTAPPSVAPEIAASRPPLPIAEVATPALPAPAPVPAPPPAPVPAPAVVPTAEAPPPAPVEAAPPPTPSVVAEDPVAARARIFREFNAFVEARGLAGRLSRTDREALFQEYLVRRYKSDLPASATADANQQQAAAVSKQPEILLFFQASAPGVQALADQAAAKLRNQMLDVTLRPMFDSLTDPIVKYFRPEDRDLALTVAAALLPAAADWKISDMSDTPARPGRPSIEVWLPRLPAVP